MINTINFLLSVFWIINNKHFLICYSPAYLNSVKNRCIHKTLHNITSEGRNFILGHAPWPILIFFVCLGLIMDMEQHNSIYYLILVSARTTILLSIITHGFQLFHLIPETKHIK